MRNWFHRFRDPILTRLSQVLRGTATPPDRRRPSRKRPLLEALEDRLAPASLTDAVGQVTIILDNPNESLTIAATATAHQYSLNSPSGTLFNTSLTGAMYSGNTSAGTLTLTSDSSISIVDTSPGNINSSAPGTAVTFGDSGSNSYLDSISVTLSNPLAGGISFTGKSTFTSNVVFLTAHGGIASAPGSLISVTNSGTLTLVTPGSINLAGAR